MLSLSLHSVWSQSMDLDELMIMFLWFYAVSWDIYRTLKFYYGCGNNYDYIHIQRVKIIFVLIINLNGWILYILGIAIVWLGGMIEKMFSILHTNNEC